MEDSIERMRMAWERGEGFPEVHPDILRLSYEQVRIGAHWEVDVCTRCLLLRSSELISPEMGKRTYRWDMRKGVEDIECGD